MAVSILLPRFWRRQAWQKQCKHKRQTLSLTLALTLTVALTLAQKLTLTLTQTLSLTPKRKLWKVLKKVTKKKKREVAKVRVELKSNGIPDVKQNRYAMSSTPMA